MRTTVTGGAGFIGSHLVEYLLRQGDEVVVLDDLSTGTLANLAPVANADRFRFVEGSILDRDTVDSVIAGADRVFHLAAAAGRWIGRPAGRRRTNFRGTENVLDACRDARNVLLLASTSENHSRNSADARSDMKGIEEALAHAYRREFGLRVATVRLFDIVGPRQTGRHGMAVPWLVGHALRGEPITVFEDGLKTRYFSYVEDVVPAMVAIAAEPATYGQAFDLGGAREISIVELAERVIEVLGSDSPIILVPHEQAAGDDAMRCRVPDDRRAPELVGVEPVTPLDEIITRVAEALSAWDPHGLSEQMVAGR
ncbi:NAD-dependent epimerase/dehydratase family protein [Prescottella soli]|uniref:NAD-dependent epimerase/dehydratase family protein n=1 Tax=Prescottella soli TaxID=1543852 RepID=A0ABW9FVF7_9NOCA